MNYVFLILTIILSVNGQFLMKHGVSNTQLSFSLISILKTIFSPFVFFGLVSYALSVVTWLFVLQKSQLSIAYPLLSLSYILVVFISIFLLKEPITLNKIFGCLLIFFGIYILYK